MFQDGWEFKIIHLENYLAYGLYLTRKLHDRSREYQTSEGTVLIKEGELSKGPLHLAIIEDLSMLKSLVDQAGNLGIKPDAAARLEGELKATEAHLLDMRAIVYKKEGLPSPESTKS